MSDFVNCDSKGAYETLADYYCKAFNTLHCESQVDASVRLVRDVMLHNVVEYLYKELLFVNGCRNSQLYSTHSIAKLHKAVIADGNIVGVPQNFLCAELDQCMLVQVAAPQNHPKHYVPLGTKELESVLLHVGIIANVIATCKTRMIPV